MKDLGWKFREMQVDQVNEDSNSAEFFATSDDSDKLVRETIQNSLDARKDKKKPVEFKIGFSSIDDLKKNNSEYLKGLEGHLEAVADIDNELDVSCLYRSMDFMTLEDFNTRGLCGDITQNMDEENSESDFYYFWRNRGRSIKVENNRGRWGEGKNVIPYSSKLSTFFGLTIRQSDSEEYLMGQSVVKIHNLNGIKYDSTAFFPKYPSNTIPLPVDDKETLEKFKESFNLKRTSQTGLSLVIPYPKESIEVNKVAKSVIKHYFYPILKNDLKVSIVGEDVNLKINKATIEKCAEEIRWDSEKEKNAAVKLFDLAKWIFTDAKNEMVVLNKIGTQSMPSWNRNLNDDGPLNPENIEILMNKDSNEERLAIEVPIDIKLDNDEYINTCSFNVYIERDEELTKGESHFIRQGLTITGIRGFGHGRYRGIVTIDESEGNPDLAGLLGDSENPAHTEWRHTQPRIKKYKYGSSIVNFVKNSLNYIMDAIIESQSGLDEKFFADYFWVKTRQRVLKKKAKKKKKGTQGSGLPELDLPNTPKGFKFDKIYGGFYIKNDDNKRNPEFIAVTAAYDTQAGKPVNHFSELDFNLSKKPILISSKGVKIEFEKPNQMIIEIIDNEYSVEVSGFDPNRDLFVDPRTVRLS